MSRHAPARMASPRATSSAPRPRRARADRRPRHSPWSRSGRRARSGAAREVGQVPAAPSRVQLAEGDGRQKRAAHGNSGKSGRSGPKTGAGRPRSRSQPGAPIDRPHQRRHRHDQQPASPSATNANERREGTRSTRHCTPMNVTPISCNTSAAKKLRHCGSRAQGRSNTRPAGKCSM